MANADTPMMQQYKELRAAHEGFLLFYRMGDFYELFDTHAVTAASILGITLTRRRSAKEGDEGIPMCGVPFHAAEGYIAKLIKSGHKVALCEQTETPEEAKAKRGYKALVERKVIRLYTGGTLTEESMLKAEENNYLSCVCETAGTLALSYVDLSTGEFKVMNISEQTLESELSRLSPSEVLVSDLLSEKYGEVLSSYPLTTFANTYFSSEQAEKNMLKTFEVKTLEAFSFESKAQVSAAGALLQYISQTQVGKLPILEHPYILKDGNFLAMNASTRAGLEITATLKGERKGSLLHAVDRTVTPYGARLIAQWLTSPLQDLNDIHKRASAIETLLSEKLKRAELQHTLKNTADVARSLSRITLGRGGPRDLKAIAHTLSLTPHLQAQLSTLKNEMLTALAGKMNGTETLASLLGKALKDEVPLLARDGGFIASGFCPIFDEHKALATGGMDMMRELEKREIERTGITNLRIKYNKVWGYFMEVTNSYKDKVPADFIHRQTTTGAMRFSSAALMELERKYSAAEANMLEREAELFTVLEEAVKVEASQLLALADALATLDVLCSGAEIAEEKHYTRPVVDGSLAFEIEEGRHSVVETTVEHYIASSSNLSNGKFWLITGPNMAGKSTFLRQNALITILAHAGFFVPAKKAHIGLVDKIFTRIGAADDLSKGQSTFMMEMVETATILGGATEKSLVILDEIGRGTATYDGLSIAWATTEHIISKNKSRGLFATHYHEMAELEKQYENLECWHVQVKEWQGNIVFLHSIAKGNAPASYGIHVGKLAGLPKSVTHRAEQILNRLESKAGTAETLSAVDLPLFSTAVVHEVASEPSALDLKMKSITPDDLSPKEALNLLYDLKKLSLNA